MYMYAYCALLKLCLDFSKPITTLRLKVTDCRKGTPPIRKIDFFQALPKLPLPPPPPPPQFGQVVQLFLDVKNDIFAHITEPSNDDYDNDVSDNCDNNFGTFDDFGVKNYQKVSPQY